MSYPNFGVGHEADSSKEAAARVDANATGTATGQLQENTASFILFGVDTNPTQLLLTWRGEGRPKTAKVVEGRPCWMPRKRDRRMEGRFLETLRGLGVIVGSNGYQMGSGK